MNRDISEIPENSCIRILDNDNIIVYTTTDTQLFTLVSNKYILIDSDSIQPVLTNYVCYTTEQIEEFPPQYDELTPIYSTIAIASALFIFWIAYKILIYPFFRKI